MRFVSAVWPVPAWMLVVFLLSTDVGGGENTGQLLQRLLWWLNPAITPHELAVIHTMVRKAAHLTEYAILALLVLRALRAVRMVPAARWSWPLAALALGLSAAYAATDEFHQSFVATRGPSAVDVLIDTSGACLGLAMAFLEWRRRVTRRKVMEPAIA